MEASPYFERTLFYDRSPDIDDYYESSADRIFEDETSKVDIEVRYQSCSDDVFSKLTRGESGLGKCRTQKPIDGQVRAVVKSWPQRPTSPDKSRIPSSEEEHNSLDELGIGSNVRYSRANNTDDEEGDGSIFSCASSTDLPTTIDQHQGSSKPPLYPGLPELTIDHIAPTDIEAFVRQSKNDFRVFYLRQKHSFSRLQVTKEAFELLLSKCRVFPRFNEYVIGFGKKHSEIEVGPPPFRYRSIYATSDRSWRGFECSYILRYIEKTDRPNKKPWSLRQFAVYHRFKPAADNRCSTWILVGASKRTEVRLDRYTRSVDDVFQANPFELHIIFLDTAIANWRPYLAHLTALVQEQTGRSSGFTISSENDAENLDTIEVEDHQQLKQIEDDVADLLLCLDSTIDTLTTFMTMYQQFSQQRGTGLGHSCHADIITVAFETKAKEISYTRKRAENLLSRIQNTRTLVSSLLERRSGHNIDQQIQALQKLEKQGQDENAIMRELAEKNARDSSSMRILTIITMVYLPCTIVSNFYSTQFVNQVESDTGNTTLEYTQNAWLFFAISVPLTIITIFVWFLWVNSARLLPLLPGKPNVRGTMLLQRARIFRTRQSLNKLPR